MQEKQTLEQLDKEHILHNYARNYTNFVKGANATLFDDKDNNYIDFASGIGVVSVGHSNERLTKVISEQASKILHVSNLFVIEPQAKLAEKLVKLSGYDMRLFFASSGAEINEAAIKIARKEGEKKGRYQIITLEHSFHGRTISALKATGQTAMHLPDFGPYPDGFVYAKDINDVTNHINEHTCAVMIELVQGEGGVTPLNFEEVGQMAKELKSKGVLLIIDEVQTGIYRTGELLASNLYEIEPDIITLAKGLGGGLPIAAVMTSLKDIFSPGDHGSTFGGNYLSTSVANEVLDILTQEKESGKLDENLLYFHQQLQSIAKDFSHLFNQEIGLGMMRALEANDSTIQGNVINAAFNAGVVVLKSGKNRVRFLPPLTITKIEIDEGFKRFKNALKTL
jgi:acetylornithine/N-succinyldiaminopimelate aminotransferase